MKKIYLILILLIPLFLSGCKLISTPTTSNTNFPDNDQKGVNKKGGFTTVIPTNCVLWFDGCNSCGVENGKIGPCTQMVCDVNTYKESACIEYRK